MKRHVLIACGGTGGHLSPGIALAEALVADGHAATLLISHKKVDTRLVEKYPRLRFLRVPGAGLVATPAGLLRFLVSQARGMVFSLALVAREAPAAVVGFGGFTTTTIILAAALRRVPVFLHEANRVPGKAIRLLQSLAHRVYLPTGVRLPGVSLVKQAELPLPVRAEMRREPAGEARAVWQLRTDRPVVAVLGGSQGASALNDWARQATPSLVAAGVQLVVVTGLGKGADEMRQHASSFGPIPVVTLAFCDRMATLLSASDLVVTRAGAGTLAEMARCGTPGILVPFPFAADNHQAANAEFFAQRGGGVVVDQREMEKILPQVLAWLESPEDLSRMQAQLRLLSQEHHTEVLQRDLQRAWEYGT